jgi:hypothetical protein
VGGSGVFILGGSDLLSTENLLSATDVQRVLGLSREGLRKLRRRGDGPPSTKVGAVSITPLDSFVDWISRELSRTCRRAQVVRIPEKTEEGVVLQ